jgi:hypothetical protein
MMMFGFVPAAPRTQVERERRSANIRQSFANRRLCYPLAKSTGFTEFFNLSEPAVADPWFIGPIDIHIVNNSHIF